MGDAIAFGGTLEVDKGNISGSIYGDGAAAVWLVYDREGDECIVCRSAIQQVAGRRMDILLREVQRRWPVRNLNNPRKHMMMRKIFTRTFLMATLFLLVRPRFRIRVCAEFGFLYSLRTATSEYDVGLMKDIDSTTPQTLYMTEAFSTSEGPRRHRSRIEQRIRNGE